MGDGVLLDFPPGFRDNPIHKPYKYPLQIEEKVCTHRHGYSSVLLKDILYSIY